MKNLERRFRELFTRTYPPYCDICGAKKKGNRLTGYYLPCERSWEFAAYHHEMEYHDWGKRDIGIQVTLVPKDPKNILPARELKKLIERWYKFK